mmetsp:Transcript_28962/g.54671  ORF Transcript_28962/g.54671 Transcript_28962/m.54671 type:complete len:280 (-) Transcript_28962:105-944(-)
MKLNNPSTFLLLLLLPLLYLSTVNCTFPPNDAYNNKINGTPSRRITLRRNVNGNIVGANKKAETLINPSKPPRRFPSLPLKPLLLLLPRLLSLFRLSRLLLLLKISLPLLLLKHSLTFLYTLSGDIYLGRHMRLTYNKYERLYLNHYQAPAFARSICRCVIQFVLSCVVGEIVQGLKIFEGIAYVIAVCFISSSFNTLVSIENLSVLSINREKHLQTRYITEKISELPQGFYFLRLLRGLDISGGRLSGGEYIFKDREFFSRGYLRYTRETRQNERKRR